VKKILVFVLSVILPSGFLIPGKGEPKRAIFTGMFKSVAAVVWRAKPAATSTAGRAATTATSAASTASNVAVGTATTTVVTNAATNAARVTEKAAETAARVAPDAAKAAPTWGQKAQQVLQSDTVRQAAVSTAITAGAAELGNFAYRSLNPDTEAGNAHAATPAPPAQYVAPQPPPKPAEPERSRSRSVRLADPGKL
jgi:hypothetical protein